MNSTVEHVKQTSQNQGSAKTLTDGENVRVRVIADKGNGNYEGSVAGVRINLKSQTALAPGSTFVAQVKFQNGVLKLLYGNNASELLENIDESKLLQNGSFSKLLSSLGLPSDNTSVALLQQFRQLDSKFAPQLLDKLYKLGIKFKGKEKKAVQLLALLEKKEILGEMSFEDIQFILDLLDQDENAKKDWEPLNKINRKEGIWYILPFELIQLEDKKNVAEGTIKILIKDDGILKLTGIDCKTEANEYHFVLEYENKKLNSVHYNIKNQKISEEILREMLGHTGFYGRITREEKDTLEVCGCGLENLCSIDGEF